MSLVHCFSMSTITKPFNLAHLANKTLNKWGKKSHTIETSEKIIKKKIQGCSTHHVINDVMNNIRATLGFHYHVLHMSE